VTDDFLNSIQEEISTAIEAAGITLDKEDNSQLLEAIPILAGTGNLSKVSREALRRVCAEAGYNLVAGSCETGAVLTSATDVVLREASGKVYSGDGPFPQNVVANTDPTAGGFVDQSGKLLRLAIKGAPLTAAQPWGTPATSYAGVRAYSPIIAPGDALAAQEFLSPTAVSGRLASDVAPPASGPIYTFGPSGLTSGPGFTQDAYALEDLRVVGAPGEILRVRPYAGATLTVKGLEVVNSGSPASWMLNLQQQNWWPIVTNNILADVTDKQGNFFKAIDDQGDAGLRYSGNSRVIFSQNRLKWLGLSIGGRGFYGSAVGNTLKDNAMEGSSIPVTLGYPSLATKIDGLYTESPFGNQCVLQVGDDAAGPNNSIGYVELKGVYNNMHNITTNKVVKMGNTQVVLNHFRIDEVVLSNVPAGAVVIQANDLPGQKIEVGRISAVGAPLLPVTANHINVLDMLSQSLRFPNGDAAVCNTGTTATPAGTALSIGAGWYAVTSAAGSVNISDLSAPERGYTRMSRKLVNLSTVSGTGALYFEHVNPQDVIASDFVIQLFAIANRSTTATIRVSAWSQAGARNTLATKTVTIGSSFGEFFVVAFGDQSIMATADVIVVSIEYAYNGSGTHVLAATGVRGYKGGCALCLSGAEVDRGSAKAITANFTGYVTP
jgi:hypothetical protein